MNENIITQTFKNIIIGETQANLRLVTLIFNNIFKSGFEIRYYFDFGTISPENTESVSRIETLFYSNFPEKDIYNFSIRSAIYQNKFDLASDEILVYKR